MPTKTPDHFVGLAFPVVKVRFAGATDTKGARYVGSYQGVRHTEGFHQDGRGTSQLAMDCAIGTWDKYRTKHPEYFSDDDERVFIPGDLDADSYAFLAIPAAFLN